MISKSNQLSIANKDNIIMQADFDLKASRI